jgi:sodium transport system permease protein
MSRGFVVVARKEILDHLRDRRSLASSAAIALLGPGAVLLVSLSGRTRGPDGEAVLLGMLSVFALVTSFAGALDIAMDSTAGERERRSLLPLLLAPIPRPDVIIGKWLAVASFALAAVAINSTGLASVLGWAAPDLLASRTSQLVLWIVLGLVPLALLGAASSLLVASLCRSTKEAHTALRFLVFVPMLVGMFLVFFPARMSRVWFLLPVVGQQALIGMKGPSFPVAHAVVLALVTLAATGVAVLAAARVLNRDDILSA